MWWADNWATSTAREKALMDLFPLQWAPLWKYNQVEMKPPFIYLTLSKYMCVFHSCSLLHFTLPESTHRLNPFFNSNSNNRWAKQFCFSSKNGMCFSCKYSWLDGNCFLMGPEHTGVNLFKWLTVSFYLQGAILLWWCWSHRLIHSRWSQAHPPHVAHFPS